MSSINLSNIQKNVLTIIRKYPNAADNDAVLISKYWQEFCQWDDRKSLEENMARATRPETITRRRRELFNLGLITYASDAIKRREEAYKNETDRPKAVGFLEERSY
jgi:hypothetical protein